MNIYEMYENIRNIAYEIYENIKITYIKIIYFQVFIYVHRCFIYIYETNIKMLKYMKICETYEHI